MAQEDGNSNTATTNTTTAPVSGAGARAGSTARTTAQTATTGEETSGATAAAPEAGAAQAEPKFFVDGKAVSEEEWLRAAGENGYDVRRLPPHYRPDISTKKHGEG